VDEGDFVPFADFFRQISALQKTSVTVLCSILRCGPHLSAKICREPIFSESLVLIFVLRISIPKMCINYLHLSTGIYCLLVRLLYTPPGLPYGLDGIHMEWGMDSMVSPYPVHGLSPYPVHTQSIPSPYSVHTQSMVSPFIPYSVHS
jgi:hypothetical protein